MEKICLDNDVVLDFLCGDKATVEKLRYYASNEQLCINAITSMELSTTIKKREVLEEFLRNISILPFDREATKIATKILNETMEKGIVPHFSTVLTASVCIANSAFLFTNNRSRFEGIKGLRLV